MLNIHEINPFHIMINLSQLWIGNIHNNLLPQHNYLLSSPINLTYQVLEHILAICNTSILDVCLLITGQLINLHNGFIPLPFHLQGMKLHFSFLAAALRIICTCLLNPGGNMISRSLKNTRKNKYLML